MFVCDIKKKSILSDWPNEFETGEFENVYGAVYVRIISFSLPSDVHSIISLSYWYNKMKKAITGNNRIIL